MHRARVQRWSQGDSVIHRRHAAARILVTLALLVFIGTLTIHTIAACVAYLLLLVIAAVTAGIPLSGMLAGAAAVLPFALCFAIVSALAGDMEQALMLVVRGYLSAFAALFLIATTPMPDLIAGLEWLRAPAFLLQVMLFLYRYLMVLMEEAVVLRQASLARAGSVRALQFRQASAAVGVLFARSWARALAIHRAMVSRGFEGRIPTFRRLGFRFADAVFAAAGVTLIAGLRWFLR